MSEYLALPAADVYCCDFEDSIIEVQAINTCLERMGASEEYCTNYFKSAGGECLKKCGSMCISHSVCCAPLPPNKMCAKEFGKRVCMLNREISAVELERENLKQACTKLKSRAAREDEADAYPPVVEEESRKVRRHTHILFLPLCTWPDLVLFFHRGGSWPCRTRCRTSTASSVPCRASATAC